MHIVKDVYSPWYIGTNHNSYNIKHYNNYSKSFLIFKQFDMKEEVNLRIEYDLLLNKKLILLLANDVGIL
jgi:hypothetical protein